MAEEAVDKRRLEEKSEGNQMLFEEGTSNDGGAEDFLGCVTDEVGLDGRLESRAWGD